MENYEIPDEQVSASSQWDANHAAIQGRLNYKVSGNKEGAWSARTNEANQWLQVDLGYMNTTVTGLATQGRNGHDQWVTRYKLQYSNDEVNFQYYKEQEQPDDKVKYINFYKFHIHFGDPFLGSLHFKVKVIINHQGFLLFKF